MVNSNPSYQKQHSKEHALQNGYEDDTFEYSMVFANRKELYVADGSSINIYNPQGGNLIEVLGGHNCRVVSICRNVQFSEEGFISCDENGHIFKWFSDRKHPEHGSSLTLPLAMKRKKISHFSISKNFIIYSYVTSGNHSANLGLIRMKTRSSSLVITKYIQAGQYKVAVSYDEKYIAALMANTVFVADMTSHVIGRDDSIYRYHKTGQIDQCCVAFHPSKDIMATGSVNGAILLWYHILERSPIKVKLHWHTMPLHTLCFSSTGGDLFSGGEECVLVRWKLTQDNFKSFLPRLGMPIRNIQTDPSNSYVAIVHADQSISIIDSESMKVEGSIQRMSKHVPSAVSSGGLLTAGLLYHTPSASFIKNGKTGHLQFFNPQLLKVNYNLDITMENFVTEERHKKLPNSDITNAAVSDDGLWLITVESCCLTQTLKEIVIKFWKFSTVDQRWELNTSIQTPHSAAVTSLAFRQQSHGIPMCVSCSEDKKFKVWKLITYEDMTGKEQSHWNNRTSREFRDLAATACAFASDDSLFVVAFENIVTLWNPEEVTMRRILTQPYLKARIVDISFSYGDWEGAALVTRSKDYICSWDLLSCSLTWRVYIKSSCLAVDRTNGLMAVFSKSNQVYFFQPQSCNPIAFNYKLKSEAVCGMFAPTNDPTTMKNSKRCLYYFDKKQSLFHMDPPLVEDSDGPKDLPVVEPSTVESVADKSNVNSSQLLSALSAKTKNITSKSVNEEVVHVDLVAPSMKDLLKDLHNVQIHSASFLELGAHVSSFLPNLSEKEEKRKPLSYETIEQRKDNITPFDKVYLTEEAQRIEALLNVDFHKILQDLQS